MSKGIKENKLTVMTKRLLLMCTNENNDKKKKRIYLPPSIPVTLFLISEKWISL